MKIGSDIFLVSFICNNTSLIFFLSMKIGWLWLTMNSIFMKKMAYLTMNEVKFLCITKPVGCIIVIIKRVFSLLQYYYKSNTVVISNEISIKEYPVRCNILSKKITEIETWYETNFLLDLNYVLYITIITRGTTQEQEEGNQKWFVAW